MSTIIQEEKYRQAIYREQQRRGSPGTSGGGGGITIPEIQFSGNGSTVRTYPSSPTSSRLQIPGGSTVSYWVRLNSSVLSSTLNLGVSGPILIRRHSIGSFSTSLSLSISAGDNSWMRIEVVSTGDVTTDTSAHIDHALSGSSSVTGRVNVNIFNDSMMPAGDPVGSIIVSTSSSNLGEDITSVLIDEGDNDDLYVRLGVFPDSDDDEIEISVGVETTGLISDISHIRVTDGNNSLINADGTPHATRRLEFDTTNWHMPQRVNVSALPDDDVDDGGYRITFRAEVDSTQSNYNLITKAVAVSHIDQTLDPSGPDENIVQLQATTISSVVSLLSVSQNENSETFHYVSLSHRPSSTVTVRPQFQDTNGRAINVGDDIRLRDGPNALSNIINTLTFTTDDYDDLQQVYIHTSEDASNEDEDYRIVYYASGGGYNGRSARVDLSVTETILVPATIELSTNTLSLNEGGSDRAYTVSLSVIPQGTVDVDISVPSGLPVNIAKGTTAPNDGHAKNLSLRFDNSDYNIPQNIFVRPDTTDSDTVTNTDNITHSISTTRRTTLYETTPDVAVAVTVTDAGVPQVPGIILTSDSAAQNTITSITIDEGVSDSYYVSLQSPPDNDVRITISGLDTSAASLSTASFVIMSENWDSGHPILVTGLYDSDSSPATFNLVHSADELTTSSGDYDGISSTLGVTVNEVSVGPGSITILPTSITLSENGRNTFRMRLTSAPSDVVNVAMTPTTGSDILLSGTEVVNNVVSFSTSDWGFFKTIEISALSDTDTSNDVGTISMRATGGGYNTTNTLSFAIVDDDANTPRRVVVSDSSLSIEEGNSDTFTVALSHPPTDVTPLTVDLSFPMVSGITINPDSLTFLTSDYNMPQTVTVTVAENTSGGLFDISNRVSPTYRDTDGSATYYNTALVRITHTEDVTPTDPVDATSHSHGTQTVSFTHRHQAPETVVTTSGVNTSGDIDDTLPDGLRITYMVLPTPT